jgi:hypothetical protein
MMSSVKLVHVSLDAVDPDTGSLSFAINGPMEVLVGLLAIAPSALMELVRDGSGGGVPALPQASPSAAPSGAPPVQLAPPAREFVQAQTARPELLSAVRAEVKIPAGKTKQIKTTTIVIDDAAEEPEPAKAEEEFSTFDTEHGEARVQAVKSGGFKAAYADGLTAWGETVDGAGEALLQVEAPAAAKPVRVERSAPLAAPPPAAPKATPAPAPTPAAVPAGDVPAALATATSLRQVMEWMIANGFDTTDKAVAKCEELRPHIPALGRIAGDLRERVSRAIAVLTMPA